MSFSSLALGVDSLIAALGLSVAVKRKLYVPLAALFGVCDMAASLLAPLADVRLRASTVAVPWLLLLVGALIVLDPRRLASSHRSAAWAYALPPLLAVDNLFVAGVTPAFAGLVSCVMAAVGFGLGVLPRRVLSPLQQRRWTGGSLLIVGLLLAFQV